MAIFCKGTNTGCLLHGGLPKVLFSSLRPHDCGNQKKGTQVSNQIHQAAASGAAVTTKTRRKALLG